MLKKILELLRELNFILTRINGFFIWQGVVPILGRDFVRDSYPTGVFSVDAAVPVGRG